MMAPKEKIPNTGKNKNRLLEKVKGRDIQVIGLGGIGTSLAHYLIQFLWSQHANSFGIRVDLLDGDVYVFDNRTRMDFSTLQTNKAVAKAMELIQKFGDRVTINPIPEYVHSKNIKILVPEKSVVFLAVDNHKTRKLVSDYCEKLKNVFLISGGNDGVENGDPGSFGNILVYERKRGRNIKNPITTFHPEIRKPQDRAPFEVGCDQLALGSAPQLLFTNLAVCSAMCNGFYTWLLDRLTYEEAYLDILSGTLRPAVRDVQKK